MKKIILVALVFFVAFTACQNEPKSGDTANTLADTGINAVDPATIQLICEPVEEPNMEADAPRHEVFLQIGEKKVKVADILACTTLPSDQYGTYQIPDEALSAVLGWWAGAGDLIYVVQEGENYVVKQGYAYEEMESNDFGYKTVLSFGKDGKEI